MIVPRFYSSIKFPIENDFYYEFTTYHEQVNLFKFILLIPFRILNNTMLKILGLNLLEDKSWPTSAKRDKEFLDRVVNPFIFVDHVHLIKTSLNLELELNHFLYIFLRKLMFVGNKTVYPQCLELNFGLKAIYELSHLRQKPIFTSEFRSQINKIFFDETCSIDSLLEGRKIIGTISDDDFFYIRSKY